MKAIALIAAAALAAMMVLPGIAAAGERLDIATDKETYFAGQDVCVTLTNNYREEMLLPSYWVEDADGMVVYCQPILFFSQFLAPGESYTYVWEQNDDEGNAVPFGLYTVNIDGSSASFGIINPVALAVTDATIVSGEDVEMALTNLADSTVFVSGGFQVLDAAGAVVYAEPALAFLCPILPGESVTYVWYQTSDDGNQVPAGEYTICASGSQVTISVLDGVDTLFGDDGSSAGNNGNPALHPTPGVKPIPRNRMGPAF